MYFCCLSVRVFVCFLSHSLYQLLLSDSALHVPLFPFSFVVHSSFLIVRTVLVECSVVQCTVAQSVVCTSVAKDDTMSFVRFRCA